MGAIAELLDSGQAATESRPWPRTIIGEAGWQLAADLLASGELTLLGLWGDGDRVHMALFETAPMAIGVVTVVCREGRFPSVGRLHPPALRPERAIRDLFGLEPEGLPDARGWLDHGRWGVRAPLGAATAVAADGTPPYRFLPVEGEGVHQIPVGPVHAGIIEPGHFRFSANGETVVRLEERLGYVHKGVEALMAGSDLARAARLAGRVSGDSTVAYALAFARAAEAALGVEPPARAVWLRALMAEVERVANHLGDIGAVCNDASFSLMLAQCSVLRERFLRAADDAFGHRLMRDCIVPGGIAADIAADGAAVLRAAIADTRRQWPRLVSIFDTTASLQERTVTTGVLTASLAQQWGCGGFVGRASGGTFDARKLPGYPPYEQLDFKVPAYTSGDVNARVWVRIHEVEHSLGLIEQILDRLPSGPIAAALPVPNGVEREGAALVEGFRGDVLVWLRLDGAGRVARCHPRDPSWFQWPLLEAVIEGNIVADFPLCNKSFNCSYSGHDL